MSKSVTKAVCRDCWNQGEGFYMDAEDAGSECPNDHDGKRYKLVKRRLFICDDDSCELAMGYTSAGELALHKKRDHDDWR